jgi:hypothetical protein
MDFKILGTRRAAEAQKTAKAKKTSDAGGVSFESLVEQARHTEQSENITPAAPLGGFTGRGFVPLPDDIPQDAKGRGAYMLDTLSELQNDILAGQQTLAAGKLKDVLAAAQQAGEPLPAGLQSVLDEIEMRASVEVAKLEAKPK